MSYNIIHNPNAFRSRNTINRLDALVGHLSDSNKPYHIFTTKQRGHATEIVDSLSKQGESTFIVSGGDGTLYEVLNGLSDDCLLGIIPAGTGNDVAKTLGLTPKSAIKCIANDTKKAIDYGLINDELKFLSLVSFGIVTDIIKMLDSFKTHSKFNYFKSLLKRALAFKPKRYTVTINGTEQTYLADYLSIHNCRYAGGGMSLCRPAKIDDGLLDLVIVEYKGTLRRIFNLIAIATNRLHTQPNVTMTQVTDAQIIALADSTCCLDGEIVNLNKLEVSVVTGKLEVYCP